MIKMTHYLPNDLHSAFAQSHQNSPLRPWSFGSFCSLSKTVFPCWWWLPSDTQRWRSYSGRNTLFNKHSTGAHFDSLQDLRFAYWRFEVIDSLEVINLLNVDVYKDIFEVLIIFTLAHRQDYLVDRYGVGKQEGVFVLAKERVADCLFYLIVTL